MRYWGKGMRDAFFDALFGLARKDKRIILMTADIGAVCHNAFRQRLPKQYINIGVAEQNMIGVAAGLTMAGKIVYVYSIIPFVTMRCYEQIRVDLCAMNLPVTVVGIGAGFDYSTLGPTHHGTEDIGLMRLLPNMSIYSPSDSLAAGLMARVCYEQPGPKYVRLDREGTPLVYNSAKQIDIKKGFTVLKEGSSGYIIGTGRMTPTALKLAQELSPLFPGIGAIDLFRIKPLNKAAIWQVIKNSGFIITLEEHFVNGGLGSIFAQFLLENNAQIPFKAIGPDNVFCRKYGTRNYLQCSNNIDKDGIAKFLKTWLEAV